MTEDVTTPAPTLPLISDSKLYSLFSTKNFFEYLTPDIVSQMKVELELDEIFPREADDGDDTRILINYINPRGNPTLYKILDNERLKRTFDIDHFMNGLLLSLQPEGQGIALDDEAASDKLITDSILFALNMSLGIVMGLDTSTEVTQATKDVSEVVLRSLVSLVFHDAKDVMIVLIDRPSDDDPTKTVPTIAQMWTVHLREGSEQGDES